MNFEDWRKQVQARLDAATPWSSRSKEPAGRKWVENIDANVDLCANAYEDIYTALKLLEKYREALSYCAIQREFLPYGVSINIDDYSDIARTALSESDEIVNGNNK